MASMSSDPHYRAPDWFTRNVFNRIVAAFTRAGISVWGSRILEVPGRKTGVPRRKPSTCSASALAATSLPLAATRSGSGTSALWAKANSCSAGAASTFRPRRSPTPIEEILRAYLRRWKWEVGQFFSGVGPDSSRAELSHSARPSDFPDQRLKVAL